MIEETALKQTDKVIEGVGVYMAHATALRYISKLKKERDRVQHLLAECKCDIGRNEQFMCADQKKITELEAELRVCQAENVVLENMTSAFRRDRYAGHVSIIDGEQAIHEANMYVDEVKGSIRKYQEDIKMATAKLSERCQQITELEAELLICRGDSRTLMKVVELFKEFGTMSGMVGTRDLRCIRDLLETYLTVPAIPEIPVNKTIANAKLIMADAILLMEAKNADYGDSWRMMRTPSITDQILVKVHRIRSIEESPDAPKVSEGIESEYRDILNYCVFAMIQIQERTKDQETKASGGKIQHQDTNSQNLLKDTLSKAISECKQAQWVM